MKDVGRNDPCPCGSGKKYKRCCGDTVVDRTELAYHHLRCLDGQTTERLLRFARQRFGEDVLEAAWDDYWFDDAPPLDLDHPEFHPFSLWFVYNWKPRRPYGSEDAGVAELFLREKGRNLDADERRFMDATLRAPYSYYQVTDAAPGAGMRLRDVLRRKEVDVQEKSGSGTVQKGLLLLGRVVEMDGIALLMGCAAQPLAADNIEGVMTLRKSLEKEFPDGLTEAVLCMIGDELREFYFDLCGADRNRKTTLYNTDGEPFVLHTLTYRIPSAMEAVHALKGLQQKVSGETDEEVLEDAERGTDGAVTKATLHWLKKGNRKNPSWESTSLGTIEIDGSVMRVEVNSTKRAERIRREIDKRFGGAAVLEEAKKEPAASLMEKAQAGHEEEQGEQRRQADDDDRRLRELPEVQAHIQQMMDRHWASWPDHPLPALRGLTPRQAARHPEGRELLEALLLEFESRNEEQEKAELIVDVQKLRRGLGLK